MGILLNNNQTLCCKTADFAQVDDETVAKIVHVLFLARLCI